MRRLKFISIKGPVLAGVAILLGLSSGMVVRNSPAVAPDPYLLWAPVGPQSLAHLGYEVAGPGDVDKDGTPDFMAGMVVAASSDSGNAISARVYSGRTGAVIHEIARPDPTEASGNTVTGVGDVNHDGFADYGVGTPGADIYDSEESFQKIGIVRVYSGQTGGLLWERYGDAPGDLFGGSVSDVPDVNGDTVPDVIVGAHGRDAAGKSTGSAYLLSGANGRPLCILNGQAPQENFGLSVAGIGDVNGDGRGDFVVGAPMATGDRPGKGRVYLYAGFPQECRLLHIWEGEEAGDTFGFAVAKAGDVTIDGIPDVIVGAPRMARRASHQQPAEGRAYVFSGATADGYSLVHRFEGRAPDDLFGHDVAGAGSCDNDSFPDLIVGAPQDSGSKPFAGAAYIFSGNTGGQLLLFEGQDRYDLMGVSTSWVGQLTGSTPPDEFAIGVKGRDVGDQIGAGSAQVLSCKEVPKPEIEVSPAALALGETAPGMPISGAVTISNIGNADLVVTTADLVAASTSSDYSISPGVIVPFNIPPGGTKTLPVVYSPATRGADLGMLHIVSNDLDEPEVFVPLSGQAVEPDINVTPAAIDFGSDCSVGTDKSTVVTIHNEGNANLVLTTLGFDPSSSTAFTLLNPPALPYTLGAGGSLTLGVRFTPVNNSGDSGTLKITSNDPDEPTVSISVVGRGKTNLNPVARARYFPKAGPPPRLFRFESDDSADPDGTIVSYLWDFGDGTTSVEADPLHAYTFDNTYIATLTVTDDAGDSDITSVAVEASATPVRSRFYGTVPHIDGDQVTEKLSVTAWISNTLRAKTSVMVKNGMAVYAIRVPGDAADEGLEVTFRINGWPAKQTGRWTSQSDTELNLTLALCPAEVALEDEQLSSDQPSALQILDTLYRTRDQLLNSTPTGRYYSKLYYKHAARMSSLLLRQPELRAMAADLVRDTAPGLTLLLEGHGDRAYVSQELVTEAQTFLDALAAADGEGALASAIRTERQRLDLSGLAGLSFEAAWKAINAPRQ